MYLEMKWKPILNNALLGLAFFFFFVWLIQSAFLTVSDMSFVQQHTVFQPETPIDLLSRGLLTLDGSSLGRTELPHCEYKVKLAGTNTLIDQFLGTQQLTTEFSFSIPARSFMDKLEAGSSGDLSLRRITITTFVCSLPCDASYIDAYRAHANYYDQYVLDDLPVLSNAGDISGVKIGTLSQNLELDIWWNSETYGYSLIAIDGRYMHPVAECLPNTTVDITLTVNHRLTTEGWEKRQDRVAAASNPKNQDITLLFIGELVLVIAVIGSTSAVVHIRSEKTNSLLGILYLRKKFNKLMPRTKPSIDPMLELKSMNYHELPDDDPHSEVAELGGRFSIDDEDEDEENPLEDTNTEESAEIENAIKEDKWMNTCYKGKVFDAPAHKNLYASVYGYGFMMRGIIRISLISVFAFGLFYNQYMYLWSLIFVFSCFGHMIAGFEATFLMQKWSLTELAKHGSNFDDLDLKENMAINTGRFAMFFYEHFQFYVNIKNILLFYLLDFLVVLPGIFVSWKANLQISLLMPWVGIYFVLSLMFVIGGQNIALSDWSLFTNVRLPVETWYNKSVSRGYIAKYLKLGFFLQNGIFVPIIAIAAVAFGLWQEGRTVTSIPAVLIGIEAWSYAVAHIGKLMTIELFSEQNSAWINYVNKNVVIEIVIILAVNISEISLGRYGLGSFVFVLFLAKFYIVNSSVYKFIGSTITVCFRKQS